MDDDRSPVPNQFPLDDPGDVRLAVIGESPGHDELTWRVCPQGHGFAGEHWEARELVPVKYCPNCGTTSHSPRPSPFVGPSGFLLNWMLRQAGWDRRRVFVGNCSQRMLTGHELENRDNSALLAGQMKLEADLLEYRPTCVLLLGNTALRCFHPRGWDLVREDGTPDDPDQMTLLDVKATRRPTPKPTPRQAKAKFAHRIGDWRGSIFESDFLQRFATGPALKCVSAYHPAGVLRQAEWSPLLQFDTARAVAEARDPALRLPVRFFDWQHTAPALLAKLDALLGCRTPLGHDIEGWPHTGVTDCSFATTPTDALWVPLRRSNGQPWWAPEEEQAIMDRLRRILESPDVPKVAHNSTYEGFVWKWAHGITLRGLADDTMLLWHEMMPELDKALEVPTSLLTRQPFWKHGRTAVADADRAFYNCTDSCVTLEICQIMHGADPTTGQPYLTPKQLAHYRLNMRLLEPALWQMLKGMAYDAAASAQLRAEYTFNLYAFQGELDRLAGIMPPQFADIADALCYKRKRGMVQDWPDVVENATPLWKNEWTP